MNHTEPKQDTFSAPRKKWQAPELKELKTESTAGGANAFIGETAFYKIAS